MKVLNINKLVTLFILVLLTLPSLADDSTNYNRVSFQVSEQQEIDNDEITVTMGVERNNQDPTKLADEINRVMDWAISSAKEYPSITRTGSDYSIRAIYSKDRHLDHWRGNSTLRLKSKDTRKLTELIQVLQKEMVIKSTANSVSSELMESTVEKMTSTGLRKFLSRAAQVSQDLGYKKYRLVAININNSGNMPRPIYQAGMLSARSAMAEQAAPPSFEAGTSTLTVNINGTIELEVTP